MSNKTNDQNAEAPGRFAGATASAIYPPECEWVIETSHGVYTERGWGFVMRAESRSEAIRVCEESNWDRIRAYNNQTGEVIQKPNPQAQRPAVNDDTK